MTRELARVASPKLAVAVPEDWLGIRVRKLARELRRTPGDVLVLLQELGFERYRSPDDMVSDVVAAKLRKASTRSVATHIDSPMPAVRTGSGPRGGTSGVGVADTMAALVPGVTRTPASPKHNGTGARSFDGAALQAEWTAVKAARGLLEQEQAQLQADKAALEVQRAALEAQRAALAADRASLEARRTEFDADRAGFEEARAARGAEPGEPDGGPPSMMEMFDGRGLKGVDEAERALAALAGAKAMGRLLEQVKVREPDVLRRLLWERLVLVGGPDVPEELDVPSVIVSQDRADIPGAFELSRRCSALGEQLMLHGSVRVVMVGIARRWHSLLRTRMDPRIKLVFRPYPLTIDMVRTSNTDPRRMALTPLAGEAPLADPAAGVDAPLDALLVWNEKGKSLELDAVFAATRTRLVEAAAIDLASWLEAVTAAVAKEGSA